jgi:AraC-like DNA-binding protein
MLVNGDDKILNIALDSGFGSVSRFYEIFVRDTGITPRAYRRSL